MGPVVPVLFPAAHVNRSPEEAGAALPRHDWAQSDCTRSARHGSTPSCTQRSRSGTGEPPARHAAPAAAVPWSWRDNRGCPCLPCLPAGILRAPTLSRSYGKGTPAHTRESGLAPRADGESGGGLPLPCAHRRYPREQSPIPRRIGGRGNPAGAHASEPGAALGPPPEAHHPSPGQTPALRSAPPAAGPAPGGERHCSGGAGGAAAGGQQAGGRCQATTSRSAGERVALPRRTRPPPHPARAAGCVPALGGSEGAERSGAERVWARGRAAPAEGSGGAERSAGRRRSRAAAAGAERAGLGLGPRPAPPLRPPGCESARLRITWRLPEAETREERKKKRLIPSSTAILYFIVTLIFIPPFYSRSV
nr:RNA-binding Raly-like protein isoform X2 [Taeniopygia guttata]